MNLENDPRLDRVIDPNAPKTLDLTKCQQMIRTAPKHARFPLGDVIQVMAEQLACAVAELTVGSTKVADANNQMLSYQKEAETANAEVRTMQTLLGTAREELQAARAELAALKAKAEKPPEVAPVPKKRGPKAKVVPITPPQAAAQ